MTKEERIAEYRKAHLGESAVANCGMKMFIIAYRNNDDIDVVFQDGTIVTNKRYKNFTKGKIANPNIGFGLKVCDRIGEKSIAHNGQIMTIIDYHNSRNIDVQFEDGTIVTNKAYFMFRHGEIKNPQFDKSQRIYQTNTATNGQKMTIVAYRKCNDIDVQFEDGTIVTGKSYHSFKTGEIANPNILNKPGGQPLVMKTAKCKIGTSKIANNGQKMTIIAYRGYYDIDVQFEDGTIVRHKYCGDFNKGLIANPNRTGTWGVSINELAILYYLKQYGFVRGARGSLKKYGMGRREIDIFHPELKIGIEYDGFMHTLEKDYAKNAICKEQGIYLIRIRQNNLPTLTDNKSQNYYINDATQLSMELNKVLIQVCEHINQRFDLNIDTNIINFENDKELIYETIATQFTPNKVGQTRFANNGQKMTLIKYRNNLDVDVQFENGVIVQHKTYNCFLKGSITNSSESTLLTQHANKKIGTSITIKNGHVATIIAYRGYHDIDVQIDNGDVYEHVSYISLKRGCMPAPQKLKITT